MYKFTATVLVALTLALSQTTPAQAFHLPAVRATAREAFRTPVQAARMIANAPFVHEREVLRTRDSVREQSQFQELRNRALFNEHLLFRGSTALGGRFGTAHVVDPFLTERRLFNGSFLPYATGGFGSYGTYGNRFFTPAIISFVPPPPVVIQVVQPVSTAPSPLPITTDQSITTTRTELTIVR